MAQSLEKSIIADILSKWDKISADHYAFVGLDGYIDKIQHPVKSQRNSENQFYSSLASFGKRVIKASGQSAQVELFTKQIKIGGNAPIMAHALASLGIRNTCIGSFGSKEIDPVFHSIHPDCDLISVARPAETNALEFQDGKLLLSELSTFNGLDWKEVLTQIPLSQIVRKSAEAHLVALVDWSNLPRATDIWRGFLDDVLKNQGKNPQEIFFDLADLTKRTDPQIALVIDLMNQFSEFGKVSLGLNENEALSLASAISRLSCQDNHYKDLHSLGGLIFEFMEIDRLIIHPIDACYVFTGQGTIRLHGKVIKEPRITTGGGDNFNAGFCFGQLNDFSIRESMILAMATSGAYVLNGGSPQKAQLLEYLEQWLRE